MQQWISRSSFLKGDEVTLAVAVIIAVAFEAVITAFVTNIITPLIAAIGGQPDFSRLDFTINGSSFGYGIFINAVISFLIIAAVVFFLVVRPYNTLHPATRRATIRTCPRPSTSWSAAPPMLCRLSSTPVPQTAGGSCRSVRGPRAHCRPCS